MSTREGMIVGTMATAKKTAGKGVKPLPLALATQGSNVARAEGRKKSKLVQEGEAAQRKLLLKTLVAQSWSLTGTANVLEMSSASDVLKAIRHLDLVREYEAARASGQVKSGPRND